MLDEPTNDVDPVRRRLLWRQVRTLADHGAAVLLVTHNVIEAERSVDRLAILDEGRVIAEGTPAELKGRLGAALRLELVLDPDALDVPVSPFGLSAVPVGNRLMVGVPMDAAGQAVAWAESLKRPARSRSSPSGRPLSRTCTWPWSAARRPDRRRSRRCSMQLLRSYRLLVTWQALRKKNYLPLMMAVQTLFSLGIVLGYPLLFPTLDRTSIYLIATGAPGHLDGLGRPGRAAADDRRAEGRRQPGVHALAAGARLAYLVADLTVWLAIVIPGVVLGVLVGAWRFGLDLQVSPLVVPAVLMVALTSTCVGYAIASLLPYMLTVIITQAIVVFVFMFSPLTFLPDKLPAGSRRSIASCRSRPWARSPAARSRRTSSGCRSARSDAGVWCVLGFGVTYAAMSRRG
jgi:ABC-2 type transport system permease protein